MSATLSAIPRPSDQDLRALYVDQQLGCPDIARRFERDAKTVHWWLQQAGIPTRARGSDPRPHFKAGERSAFAGRRHDAAARTRIGAASVGRQWAAGDTHWLRRAAPEDNPNWKGGATPERQAFYRTPEWKSACRAVWTRADACCERCTLDWRTVDRKTTPAFHVHHMVSFHVVALRAAPANLALLCRPCHRFVHSKANASGEFLALLPAEAL